jgi:hypothetical protein
VVAGRRVFHDHDVLGLHADESQFFDRGSAVVEQPPPIVRLGPCLGDHLGAVERSDVGLVGGDDGVQYVRVDQGSLGQQLLEGLGTQRRGNAVIGFANSDHVVFSR